MWMKTMLILHQERTNMKHYTDEELKKIQKISLDMAKYFIDFCNKNNLRCYLCGGGGY